MKRLLSFIAMVLVGLGLVFVLVTAPIPPNVPEQFQFWTTGIGLGVSFLIVVMIILSFFLPFFVHGIYNQTTITNKQLIKITELLQAYEVRLKL